MTYYINGQQVTQLEALEAFVSHAESYGAGPDEMSSDWLACQTSENARDNYLPSHIELVA
jgi:hypothetical protein